MIQFGTSNCQSLALTPPPLLEYVHDAWTASTRPLVCRWNCSTLMDWCSLQKSSARWWVEKMWMLLKQWSITTVWRERWTRTSSSRTVTTFLRLSTLRVSWCLVCLQTLQQILYINCWTPNILDKLEDLGQRQAWKFIFAKFFVNLSIVVVRDHPLMTPANLKIFLIPRFLIVSNCIQNCRIFRRILNWMDFVLRSCWKFELPTIGFKRPNCLSLQFYVAGAERLLNHLHHHKVPMALATASHKTQFDLKTKRHSELFQRVFDHAITGDQVMVQFYEL